jgi:virulence-associated protein VapD
MYSLFMFIAKKYLFINRLTSLYSTNSNEKYSNYGKFLSRYVFESNNNSIILNNNSDITIDKIFKRNNEFDGYDCTKNSSDDNLLILKIRENFYKKYILDQLLCNTTNIYTKELIAINYTESKYNKYLSNITSGNLYKDWDFTIEL